MIYKVFIENGIHINSNIYDEIIYAYIKDKYEINVDNINISIKNIKTNNGVTSIYVDTT
jgi:hypothetical protein